MSSVTSRNGGAHFKYIEGFLERNDGGKGYFVGKELSIADIQVILKPECEEYVYKEYKCVENNNNKRLIDEAE